MFATETKSVRTEQVQDDSIAPGDWPVVRGFRLLHKLGQGGMGTVYLARDCSTQQRCAIKVMRPERLGNPIDQARFQSESDALRQLSHPNVVRFLDAGESLARVPYISMESVSGENMMDLIDWCGPLPPGMVVQMMRQICSALGHVHAHGMVHRDIKPANLIAADQGRRFVLIDFGLVGCLRSTPGEANRPEATFAGSPLYAPPESYAGRSDLRSDIYSLGATAYHLLAGRPVFAAAHPIAAFVSHTTREPVAIRTIRPEVPPTLDTVIMRCLRKDPADRFQSMPELLVALDQLS